MPHRWKGSMHRRLTFIAQILIVASTSQIGSMSALAESPRLAGTLPPIKCMGVSSAWTTEGTKATGPLKGQVKMATTCNSRQHPDAPGRDAPKSNQRQDLEAVLDTWQKDAKNFWLTTAPRVTSFVNWGMKRLGIGSSPPAAALVSAPKGTVKINVQSVSSKHPVWLLRDGRLKTVAKQ